LVIFLVALLTGIGPSFLNAQLIDNANGKVFTNKPFFNEQVIKEKGIKSISGKEIHYKLGDKPRETEFFKTYVFNEKGQLTQQNESVELTKTADTLITYYDYDKQGNLIALRQRDEYGNYAYIYDYDEQGRVINEEYRRYLAKKTYTSPSFKLGKDYTVSAEKSTYQDFDNQQKRTIYNSYGDPYKYIIINYNKEGLIAEEVERLNRMPGVKTTKFHYNKKNDLDSITVRSNISGFQNRSFVYDYDELGNLVKKEEFKNGKYITQYQVLYDEETMLIDDVLVQHISTDFIKVLELRKYSYYGSYR